VDINFDLIERLEEVSQCFEVSEVRTFKGFRERPNGETLEVTIEESEDGDALARHLEDEHGE
jgi:hypothetical protein